MNAAVICSSRSLGCCSDSLEENKRASPIAETRSLPLVVLMFVRNRVKNTTSNIGMHKSACTVTSDTSVNGPSRHRFSNCD